MRFVDTFKVQFCDDAEFDAKHDRDKNEKFSSGGESQGAKEFDSEKFKEVIGPEFRGIRRQAAVRKLIQERQGQVKGAFYRGEVGYIDLVWGNEKVGLKHLIDRRSDDGFDADDVASDLSDSIQNGDIAVDDKRNNYRFWKNRKEVIVSKLYFGKELHLVITAYPAR